MNPDNHNSHEPSGSFAALMIGAIGVVYGDVGTSPLYTWHKLKASLKDNMPHALLLNFAHNRVLHERVVLFTISTADIPVIRDSERLDIKEFKQGFYGVTANYGFMETPNIPSILRLCRLKKLAIEANKTSFFIGKETLVPSEKPDLNTLQEKIFLTLFKNASSAIQFFDIPAERAVEIGAQFEV